MSVSDTSASQAGREALASIERDWNAAAQNWNVEALTAVYTEDALMYGGRPGLSVGHAGVRAYFASYVGILAETELKLVDQHIIQLAPETFVAQGYGEFQFVLAGGKRAGTVMRTTLIVVKRGGRWRIIQHHFSPTPETPPIPQ